jgi:hypothetical protein
MNGNLVELTQYLENVLLPVKVIREQAEAIIQKAMTDDLSAFCEVFIVLLTSRHPFTPGGYPTSMKVTACLMLEKHFKLLGRNGASLPSDTFIESLQSHLLRVATTATDRQIKRMCSFLIGEVCKINK